MKKILKISGIIFSSIAVAAVIAVISLYIMSPSSAGKEIAAKKGLPYHAVAAHRGASYYAPENTIPSFIIARELGADYLECDVQKTKDGKLIIFHDKTPDRTTNAAEVFPGRERNPIGSFTYKELMQLDTGSWFNKKNPDRARQSFKGLKICTFQEYVDSAESSNRHPGLLIELKDPKLYPGIEKEVIDILIFKGRTKNPKAVIIRPDMIQSFDKNSLARCRDLAPYIPRNYLVAAKGEPETEWDERGWPGHLEDAISNDAEIGPSGYLGWPWYTGKAHKKGLLVIMYTIDKDFHFRLLNYFGTDWMITNKCDKALEFYGRKPLSTPDDIMNKYNL
jgi:glycerophosphoryl diester phosphodiesterase